MNLFWAVWCRLVLLWLCGFAGLTSPAVYAADYLDPEQAFQLTVRTATAQTLDLAWRIAPEHLLYRDKIKVTVNGQNVLAAQAMPKASTKYDRTFNKNMAIYRDALQLSIALPGSAPWQLSVQYQGCADSGFCYLPMDKAYLLKGDIGLHASLAESPSPSDPALSTEPSKIPTASVPSPAVHAGSATQDETSLAQQHLQSGNLWHVVGAFFVFGLLLSLTPCVLPMLPILSSIIVGQQSASHTATPRRGLTLAIWYSLGMALVYTCLGVAAGLAGQGLAAWLQNPWVLASFASLLVLLALSMFDVYELQLPNSWQNRMNQLGSNLPGGRFGSVFVMGALSALVVSPCVAAPLAGALIYISQSRDVWLGAWALFALSMGMSVPLWLLGASAGALLPKAGGWMLHVKHAFGLLLLAVAIWIVGPALPPTGTLWLWGAWLVLCAVYLRLFTPMVAEAGLLTHVGKVVAVFALIAGVCQWVGASMGSTDPLRPLASGKTLTQTSTANLGADATLTQSHFRRVSTVAELESTLAQSQKPVLLDFYADWCVSCKEMERFTFSETVVQQRLADFELLQIDVTQNSEQDRALLKRFGLFGPPAMILFSSSGEEIPNARAIGFLAVEPFLAFLQKANAAAKP